MNGHQKTYRWRPQVHTSCSNKACSNGDEDGFCWAHGVYEVSINAFGGHRWYCSVGCLQTCDGDAIPAGGK